MGSFNRPKNGGTCPPPKRNGGRGMSLNWTFKCIRRNYFFEIYIFSWLLSFFSFSFYGLLGIKSINLSLYWWKSFCLRNFILCGFHFHWLIVDGWPCTGSSIFQYKLCKVKKNLVGLKGVPSVVTSDGRTIRYPDPAIKINDTIRVNIATGKIEDYIKFDSGVGFYQHLNL